MQLYEHDLPRTRRVRHPSGRKSLLQQGRQRSHRFRSGDARRHHPRAKHVGSGNQSQAGDVTIQPRHPHHERRRLHHRGASAGGRHAANRRHPNHRKHLSGIQRVSADHGRTGAGQFQGVHQGRAGNRRIQDCDNLRPEHAESNAIRGRQPCVRYAGRHADRCIGGGSARRQHQINLRRQRLLDPPAQQRHAGNVRARIDHETVRTTRRRTGRRQLQHDVQRQFTANLQRLGQFGRQFRQRELRLRRPVQSDRLLRQHRVHAAQREAHPAENRGHRACCRHHQRYRRDLAIRCAWHQLGDGQRTHPSARHHRHRRGQTHAALRIQSTQF